MNKDPSSLAAEMAQATMSFVNLMGFFASPRIIAKAPESPSREHVLEQIEDFLNVIDRASHPSQTSEDGSWRDSEPHVVGLRELFREWTPMKGVSSEIVRAARACLFALGIPEPAEGWDSFEGPGEDSPDAEPQLENATPFGEARKSAWSFLNWAGVFAIPALFATHEPTKLRAEVLQYIDRYLEAIDLLRDYPVQEADDKRGLLRLGPYALKLRELLHEWEPSRPVPSDIVQTVDACLKAVGVTFPAPEEES